MRVYGASAPSLYTTAGQRKYINAGERPRFIAAAKAYPRQDIGALCLTLTYSGCRISEALALTPACIDFGSGFIAIRSLKKRNGAVVIREVPVPADLLKPLIVTKDNAADVYKNDETLFPLTQGK